MVNVLFDVDDGSENARELQLVQENQKLRRQLRLVSLGLVMLPLLLAIVLLQVGVLDNSGSGSGRGGGNVNAFREGSAGTIGIDSTSSSSSLSRRTLTQQQDGALEPTATGACQQCQCSNSNSNNVNVNRTVTLNIVALEARNIFSIVEESARDFEAYVEEKMKHRDVHVKVKINVAASTTMPAMYNDIINDANSGGGIFDGYFTNPVILGTVAPLEGFLDLAPFVQAQQTGTSYRHGDGTFHANPDISLDWTDVLLPFRKYVAQFEGKIYMLPLDGDIHSMYIRKDVLEHFGLAVPRTWDEYNAVAKAVHGKVYNNITLSGSCVSRVVGSHGQYWSHLILASLTQTDGPQTGSMFDTQDMKPLTGEAFMETLRILEQQALYGVVTEFDDLNLHEVHSYHMNDGTCALTYSWGDTYKLHRAEGSVIGPGQLGVYPTPGSTKVLDRETMKLVPCTKERCKYGTYYEDIGWVNYAPYLANGGWSGAVSANADPEKQRLVAEFFLFACAKKQALKGVIPRSTTPWSQLNSQDPFRKSQLEVEKWVEQGYDAVSAKEYQITVLESTLSQNLAVDMRTPEATEIMGVLDVLVHDHLIKIGPFATEFIDLEEKRRQVTDTLTARWIDLIRTYDERGDTAIPILQIYQRLRDVYVPDQQLNQLTAVRPLGWTLLVIIWISSFACLAWVFLNRTTRIVRAAQPFFLYLIVVGTIVMSSSIVPMSIDDSIASQRGCDIACMAAPWLAATGFTLTFSALFSKIWRLNQIMKGAQRFKKVELAIKDVILPLVILMCLNMLLLLVWTIVDPLHFERVDTGRTGSGELSSYGTCASEGKTSIVMISLILIVNATAVLLANIQAYQTRRLSTDFSESKWIGLCLVSILQALLIGAPLIVLAGSNPTGSFVVRAMLVFVICMSVLGLLFVPKVRNKGKPPSPIRASQMNSSVTNQPLGTAPLDFSDNNQPLGTTPLNFSITNQPLAAAPLNSSIANQPLRSTPPASPLAGTTPLNSVTFVGPDAARSADSADQEQNINSEVVSGSRSNRRKMYPKGVTRKSRRVLVTSLLSLDINDESAHKGAEEPKIMDHRRGRNSEATQDYEEFANEKVEEEEGEIVHNGVEELKTIDHQRRRNSETTQNDEEFAMEKVKEEEEGEIPSTY